jgi:hypothetical protein
MGPGLRRDDEQNGTCTNSNFKHCILRKQNFAISPHSPREVCLDLPPASRRGRGECRVPNAPAAWCALGELSMHTSIHSGGTGNIRHSPRNGFNAYSALSPETNSSCLRRQRIDGIPKARSGRHAFANLTPATGARTTRLRVRINAARLARLSRSLTIDSPCDLMRTRHRRVHHIPPNVRDDRETPLCLGGTREGRHRFRKNRSEIFFA